MEFIRTSNKIVLPMKREDTRVSILCLKVLNDLKFLSTQCLLQLTQHYCFIKRSLHCPYSYKFCLFQGQPNTESVKWLAFISLIKCNLIIRDYKELFFSLTLSQSSRKVQNPQNRVYLVLITNTGLHPSGLSKTRWTGPLNEKD